LVDGEPVGVEIVGDHFCAEALHLRCISLEAFGDPFQLGGERGLMY
jgi:hypothetical protein